MGRKKQNPQESVKHQRVLDMAAKMFMTQSYHEVSMDALADAVPVSKRTLYNHFKDKKALFSAVMQARCQYVFKRFTEELQQVRSVEQTLIGLGRQFLGVVLEPDAVNIYRTAIMQTQHFPDLGKRFYEMGPKRSTAVLAEYLRKMHGEGKLHITDAELAANTFLGMLINRTHMKCLLGLKKSVSKAEREKIIRYVVQVFFHGNQPR